MLKIRPKQNHHFSSAFLAEASLHLLNPPQLKLPKSRHRMIAIALSTIPVLIVGVVGTEMFKRKATEHAIGTQQATAQMAIMSIQSYVQQRQSDIIPTQQSYSVIDRSNRLILASGQDRFSPECPDIRESCDRTLLLVVLSND
jgi:hypothetical protein